MSSRKKTSLSFCRHLSSRHRVIVFCLFTFVATVFSASAFATLGEDVASIDRDAATFSGKHTHRLAPATASGSSYTVHEITTDNKTIKEYVRPDGKVFAISWRGRSHPDLSVLLGAYHDELVKVKALEAARRRALGQVTGRGPSATSTSKMKIFKGGHMRDVTGLAYDLELIPEGIEPQELYK